PLDKLMGHMSFVNDVQFMPDGNRIVSAGDDNTIRVWDRTQGRELFRLPGHSNRVEYLAVAGDGHTIVSGGQLEAKVWDAESDPASLTLPHPSWVNHLAFSPDGRQLVTAGQDGKARTWESATGRPLKVFPAHTDACSSVAFRPDGKEILSAGMDNTLRLWDVEDATPSRILFEAPKNPAFSTFAAAYSLDGRRVVSAGRFAPVRLIDAVSGKVERTFPFGGRYVVSVAFRPGHTSFATAESFQAPTGQFVRLWNMEDGRELSSSPFGVDEDNYSRKVGSLAFSPDGRKLAVGLEMDGLTGGVIAVYDVETGRTLMTLRDHTSAVTSVSFSPDARRIATASLDKTVKIWDLAHGRVVFTLRGHSAGVVSVAFSPDGRRLATGSLDKTAKIWDAPNPR
ncbi:WD40 repeat domain-containing protein, partial [Singulisphaera rosea]